MSIVKEIQKIIKEEYQKGATQDDLAKKYNISQAQIARLLSNNRSFDKVYISTVDKMFPKASVNLSGNIGNNSPHAIIGNNFLSDSSPISNLIQQKIKSIMSNPELTSDEKVKFIQILIGD